MNRDVFGIHHVTAITSDAQRNLDFYANNLGLRFVKIKFSGPYKRFDDEQVITLYDPDGLELELVAHKSAEDRSVNVWKEGPIPTNQAIRGFYSVTLSEEGYERTASVLTDELGFMPT